MEAVCILAPISPIQSIAKECATVYKVVNRAHTRREEKQARQAIRRSLHVSEVERPNSP